jgi:hypothetical protein
VVAGCSPGFVLGGGSEPSPIGIVVPSGEFVAGGTETVVSDGVSLPATMIDLREPHAAVRAAAAIVSATTRRRVAFIPSLLRM